MRKPPIVCAAARRVADATGRGSLFQARQLRSYPQPCVADGTADAHASTRV